MNAMKRSTASIKFSAATLALLLLASSALAAHGAPVVVAKLNPDHGSVTANAGLTGAGSSSAMNMATVQVASLRPMTIVSDDASPLLVYPFWISYSDSSALLDIAINLAKPAVLEKLFVNCASANKAVPVSEFEVSTAGAQPAQQDASGTGDSASPGVFRQEIYSNVFWPTSIVEGSSTLVLTSLGVPVQSRLIIEPLAPANTPVQFCHGSAVFRSLSL
jgi:hypothetical protein